MVQRNKALIRHLMKKRDKAYETLRFNHDYIQVASGMIDKQDSIVLRRRELKSKKKLLPLELASLSPEDRSAALVSLEEDFLTTAYDKKKAAIELKFADLLRKQGDEKALHWKNAALKRLSEEWQEKSEQIKRKHASSTFEPVSAEAISAFQEASKKEQQVIDELKTHQAAEKTKKVNALKTKLEKQNIIYQKIFDNANKRLKELNGAGHETLIQKESVLSIEGLKMYFSGIKAVDDLSFDVKKGEIFGLIGPNGAGKTTVFNCVTQFYKPTAGQITYLDRFGNTVSLTDLHTSDIIKTGIARTFQNLELVYWLSVIDNLLIGAHAFYRSTLADQFIHTAKFKREEEIFRQRAMKLLNRLGILAYKDMFPYGLPYGVLKKVELARTLMSDPQLIILDEPAAGLNESETEQLEDIIRLIRDDFHCTIFLVEHDMNLVMNVCDTVCAMSFGKLLSIGTPEQIQSNQLVQEAYLGTD